MQTLLILRSERVGRGFDSVTQHVMPREFGGRWGTKLSQ